MPDTNIANLGPCLLVAMPQLADPNFNKTTSLLSEYDESGAMGFVLNRPLQIPISELLKGTYKGDLFPLEKLYAFWGGPIQNDRGFVVHEDETLAENSIQISRGLFVSGSNEILVHLIDRMEAGHPARFRLFLGYSGWGPKQLENEIAQASWLTLPIDHGFVFHETPDAIWKLSFEKMGIDPNQLASTPQNLAN